MSVIPKDTIKVIAETIGITNITDELASALGPDVEYRIRDIVQEAFKYMHHSKRSKLLCQDVNRALKLKNLETLFGYSNKTPLNFLKAGKDLYFVEDKEQDFADILSSPLPKCPRDTVLGSHWLAVEGVQPAIPQNPPPEEFPVIEQTKKKPATTSAMNNNAASASKIKVKPLVKHVLSQELQQYYEKITTTIKGTDNEVAEAQIQSLGNDPGVQLLVPYLIQFVSDEVTQNLTNLKLLVLLMRLLRTLLESSYLRLHQMMPSLLTCLVGKKLCESPTQDHWSLRDFVGDTINLISRKFGEMYKTLQPRIAKTLVQAFTDFSKPFPTYYGAIVGITGLGPEVVELLLLPNFEQFYKKIEPELKSEDDVKKLEAKKCLTALLGAGRVYVSHLTPEFVDSMRDYHAQKAESNEMEIDDEDKRTDKTSEYYQQLYEVFGESILPFVSTQKELLTNATFI